MVSSEMGEELLHSLSAVFSSNRQYPFRLLFYRVVTGHARPKKWEVWRKSGGKRDPGRSCLAAFSFLCLNPLAQDTPGVSLRLTT